MQRIACAPSPETLDVGRSVFDEHWMLTDVRLGGASVWRSVESCPAQSPGVEF